MLLEIVDRATERLRELEAKHQRVADQLEALQPDILRRDRSKFGEQFYRILGSCDRLQHRNIDAIHKIRRNEAQGWGRVRSERAQRREEKRRDEERQRAAEADPRLVLDEHGTVRYAFDYEGDVEEGLARYDNRFKTAADQVNAASGPNGAERAQDRAVAEFAHSNLMGAEVEIPVSAEPHLDASSAGAVVEAVQDEGRDLGQTIDVAAGLEGGIGRVEVVQADPVIVVGKGEASNVQNKVPPNGRGKFSAEVRADVNCQYRGDGATAHKWGEACGEVHELEELAERCEKPIVELAEGGAGWRLAQTLSSTPILSTGGE